MEHTSTPDISIITPVYNPGELFSVCLESLAAQTIFERIEIVLVDDGSTDGSQDLCDEFAAQHANVRVFHQENRGQGAARNRAVAEARGTYLQFVDSDDSIDANACETLLAHAERSGADIVWGDYAGKSLFAGPVAELAKRGPVPMHDYMRTALGANLFFITPCVQLVRASMLARNGVAFPEGRIFEDMHWLLRLILTDATVQRIDLPFYHYNIGDHRSSTTVVTPKRLMDAVDVVYAMIADIEAANPPREAREVAEAYVASDIAILTRTFIRHAPKRVQELIRMRMNDTYLHYAQQTQLLPKGDGLLGATFVTDPELFESEIERIYGKPKKGEVPTA